MNEFSFGPFTYAQLDEHTFVEGRKMCAWQLSYGDQILGVEFLRLNARSSTIQEVFEAKRSEFVAKHAKQTSSAHKFGWIAQMLPAHVLSIDFSSWSAPNHFELTHVVGIGSFTGITVEQAAKMVGISAVNFRKYIAREGAKNRTPISFAAWHLLLERLQIKSINEISTSPSTAVVSATLNDTLKLAREISDYLKKLPTVPITRNFITRVDQHLTSAHTIAAQRMAQEDEQENNARKNIREAVSYSAAALPIIKVEVQGDSVILSLALVERLEDYDEHVLKLIKREILTQLRRGLKLQLKSMSSEIRSN